MSVLRRLFGGDDRGDGADAAAPDAADGPPEGEDEPLSEELRGYLRPRDEFIARQQRFAEYRWEPPPNEPQRDPRLARLGRLLDTAGAPSREHVATVVAAYKRRGREFDHALSALRQRAGAAGRGVELSAADSARPRDAGARAGADEDASDGADPSFLEALRGAAHIATVGDLATADEAATLAGPWSEAFGPLP